LSYLLKKVPLNQYIHHPARAHHGIVPVTADDNIGSIGWLINRPHTRNLTRLALLRIAIDPLGIALYAYFQRTLDEHFDESWNGLPGTISIRPAIGSGIKDYRYTVFG
jgi:hypothetical protein